MRIRVTLDDELLKDASELTGITDPSALLHAGLTHLVQREAARRLAKLGGSMPNLQSVPRRRPPLFTNDEWHDEANETGDIPRRRPEPE